MSTEGTKSEAAEAGQTQTTGQPPTQDDGAFQAETAKGPEITADKADAMRRAAFAKATGKVPAEKDTGPTASSAKTSDDEASDDSPGDDAESEFDQDNGLDASGNPARESAKAKEPTKPARKDADPATPQERERLVIAKRALRLDAYSDADLSELSNAAIIRLGTAAQQRHAKTSAALREAAAIRQRAAGGNAGDDDSDSTAGSSAGHSATTRRRAPDVDPIDDLLAELEGEERPSQEEAPEVDPELATTQKRLAHVELELLARDMSDGVRSLLGDFPQLRGQEAKEALYRAMSRLDPQATAKGNKDTLHRLMREAAYIEFGPQLTERAREERKKRAQQERDGQPDRGGDSTREPARRMSQDDKRRAAYEASKTAVSREESQRLYRAKVGSA